VRSVLSIALYGGWNCLTVPAILAVRGVYAGQSGIGGCALFSYQRPAVQLTSLHRDGFVVCHPAGCRTRPLAALQQHSATGHADLSPVTATPSGHQLTLNRSHRGCRPTTALRTHDPAAFRRARPGPRRNGFAPGSGGAAGSRGRRRPLVPRCRATFGAIMHRRSLDGLFSLRLSASVTRTWSLGGTGKRVLGPACRYSRSPVSRSACRRASSAWVCSRMVASACRARSNPAHPILT
jgi:hypothetical protein